MKKEVRIGVSALASLVLAAAIWALPPKDDNAAKTTANKQTAAQTQSVSGKIASVEKTSFTLTVASADRMSRQSQEPRSNGAAKTMAFQVDKNTTIDGKLQVGANADVTYREEGGSNIAISVRVTP
jgi:uncharacterized lipoprotein YbaY